MGFERCILFSSCNSFTPEGRLKKAKNSYKNLKPGWQIQLEQQISSYRRRPAFVDLILKCKEQGEYTKHRRNIEQKLKRWYRKTSVENLNRVRTTLKEKLAASTEKLRGRKIVREREIINRIEVFDKSKGCISKI